MEKPPLTPPPRTLPSSLRWRVLLGGILPTIAFAMLTIGGFMATVFVSNSEAATWLRFATELATTEGTVLDSDRTKMRHNSSTIMRVDYDYRVNGEDFVGHSFCQDRVPQPDETVLVEYAVDAPATSRIQGMRSAPFPAITAIVLLFPFVATLLLLIGIHRGRKRIRLMTHGVSAWGLLTDRQPTNTRINNATVYKLTFTYVDEDGERQTATDRSHKSEFFDDQIARHVLQVGKQSCIVELLPGKPKLHNDHWAPTSGLAQMRVFILPLCAITAILIATQITL